MRGKERMGGAEEGAHLFLDRFGNFWDFDRYCCDVEGGIGGVAQVLTQGSLEISHWYCELH